MNEFIQLLNEPGEILATLFFFSTVWFVYRSQGLAGVAKMLCVKIGEHQDQKSLVSAIADEQNKILEKVILPKSGAKVIEVDSTE